MQLFMKSLKKKLVHLILIIIFRPNRLFNSRTTVFHCHSRIFLLKIPLVLRYLFIFTCELLFFFRDENFSPYSTVLMRTLRGWTIRPLHLESEIYLLS